MKHTVSLNSAMISGKFHITHPITTFSLVHHPSSPVILLIRPNPVSQLISHRPDYQKLHVLRTHFPHVPILALSATCPPKVLQDLIKTLGLKGVVDGNSQSCPPPSLVPFPPSLSLAAHILSLTHALPQTPPQMAPRTSPPHYTGRTYFTLCSPNRLQARMYCRGWWTGSWSGMPRRQELCIV